MTRLYDPFGRDASLETIPPFSPTFFFCVLRPYPAKIFRNANRPPICIACSIPFVFLPFFPSLLCLHWRILTKRLSRIVKCTAILSISFLFLSFSLSPKMCDNVWKAIWAAKTFAIGATATSFPLPFLPLLRHVIGNRWVCRFDNFFRHLHFPVLSVFPSFFELGKNLAIDDPKTPKLIPVFPPPFFPPSPPGHILKGNILISIRFSSRLT